MAEDAMSFVKPGMPIGARRLDPIADLPLVGVMSYLLLRDSWGWSYIRFVDPIDEIRKAEFIYAAFDGPRLVGFAVVNRLGDPRPGGKGNGQMWFSCWWVDPDYRRAGIGKMIYDECVKYMDAQPGFMYLSSENREMHSVLLRYGWVVVDDKSLNEAGDPTKIYFLSRGE